MFEFTDEHTALREVLRDYFAATTTDPAAVERGRRWRRLLTEVGVDELVFDETGSATVELAILAEEAGAALFDGPLLSAAAAAGVAGLVDQIRDGTRRPAAAVSLTGGYPTDMFWDYDEQALFFAERPGGAGIVVYDGGGGCALSSLDPSRPLGRVNGAAVSPVLECSVDLAVLRRRTDLVLAAELLGVAQRALDGTVDYVGQRVQFGRTVGSFQAVKHRLADLLAAVELTRSAVYAAAWQLGAGTIEAEVDLAVAAALARDTAVDVTKAAVQLHGGIGITWEHWAHRYLRRAHSVIALTGAAVRQRRRLAALLDAQEGADA